ncbi:Putative sensory transduction regulator [Aliiroseovarius halocynthiae]|uniref:YbjN domain-containing protein n=1 Tax=Aliiroseovarius halocynthiae TaxID=985055 RepID=A0A545SN43_9RHOB|nr:YbjN domain-containing protein [Aliiroseovarius halocynthiae]TQV66408.1 YbjN domain-containing protein [Aliiroseovarius halocynthiae]SMR83388.1 Putative sensory transduction regulator [Aliiroseovarius halocynthiae]
MKSILFSGALALSLLAGHVASAQQVKASEPESVLAYFEELGAPAKLVEDSVGDPSVEVQYYGTSMVVFFYGCRDNKNCNSLQFFAAYTKESEISLDGLNEWNAEQRYGRAYRAEDGRKMLEYDIYTGQDGVSMTDFDEVFDIWTEAIKSFEDALS